MRCHNLKELLLNNSTAAAIQFNDNQQLLFGVNAGTSLYLDGSQAYPTIHIPNWLYIGSDKVENNALRVKGQVAVQGESPHIAFIDTSTGDQDWAIESRQGKFAFVREPCM